MLKTYRIIPFVFILFLFGLTLMTVSPVFAQQDTVKLKTSDDLPPPPRLSVTTSTPSPSRAELPLGVEDVGAFESKENQDGFYMLELEAVETKADGIPDSESEPTHLNERILQLHKGGVR